MHGQKNIKLNSAGMVYGFNTCFGSYTRSHHQGDKTAEKNECVNRSMFFTSSIDTRMVEMLPAHIFTFLWNHKNG